MDYYQQVIGENPRVLLTIDNLLIYNGPETAVESFSDTEHVPEHEDGSR